MSNPDDPLITDPVGKDTGASLNSPLPEQPMKLDGYDGYQFCPRCGVVLPCLIHNMQPLPASEPPTTSIVMTNCRFYDKDGREQSGEEVRRNLQAWGIFVDPAENRVCRTCRFLSAPHTYAEGVIFYDCRLYDSYDVHPPDWPQPKACTCPEAGANEASLSVDLDFGCNQWEQAEKPEMSNPVEPPTTREPDESEFVPEAVRRELFDCAVQNGRIDYQWLLRLYLRGVTAGEEAAMDPASSPQLFARIEAALRTLKSETGDEFSRADWEIHHALVGGLELIARIGFLERQVASRERHIQQLIEERQAARG